MRKLLIYIPALFLCNTVLAQKDLVVTSKADTLKGDVRILTYDIQDRVQITIEKKKKIFNALEVLYATMDGEVYKPVRYGNTIRMMKLMKEGYLNLYAFRMDGQNTYDGRFIVKRDGPSMEVPNLTFKKTVSDYLQDCDAIAKKVKNGDYARKDIEKIVEEYNACIVAGNTAAAAAALDPVKTSKTESISELSKKIAGMDFSSRNDAMELLKDMQGKVVIH